MRILINASSIESTFVSPTLVLADKALQRLTEGGHLPRCVFISADGFHTQGRSGCALTRGGIKADEMSRNKTSGPSQNWNGNMLFTKDLAADIESIISYQSCKQLISDRSTKRELGDMQSLRARLLEDRKMATNSMNQIEFRLADARVSLPIRGFSDIRSANWIK